MDIQFKYSRTIREGFYPITWGLSVIFCISVCAVLQGPSAGRIDCIMYNVTIQSNLSIDLYNTQAIHAFPSADRRPVVMVENVEIK